MKSPINSETPKSVNLSPEDVARAEALALDDGTIRALVEIIFSQKDDRAPLS